MSPKRRPGKRPRTLSHYRLVEKIGVGGMGEVWRALDTRLDRTVAVKILPEQVSADRERKLRFQREARAAAALNHPHIAVIHEVDEQEGVDFLVMELVEGRTLRERIGHGSLPPKEWVKIALPIAEGLAHARRHGIVHRDLKPDNVMITSEGQVKLLDFGLAKQLVPEPGPAGSAGDSATRLETISRDLTRAGTILGTVAYMSPEQARGEPTDHRSDLFSFGIVLYEMAGGRLPFRGKSEVETLHSIIAEQPVPLTQVAPGVPPEADRIVRKAMEKEPERRYQHADDLAADLRNLQRDLDTGSVSASTAAVPRGGARRVPVWALVGSLGLTAILIAGGLYLSSQIHQISEPRPRSPAAGAIAVVGFENLSDPADSEHLGRMLTGLITTDLAESGGLTVISTPKVLAALRQLSGPGGTGFDTAVAAEAARRVGAGTMLVGQVGKAGERLLLTSELIDVETGNTLGSQRTQADSPSELFASAGAIAAGVRDRLGILPATSSRPFDLARALTASPEAYRQYVAGEIAFHAGLGGEAIERLDHAVREDPTFALAHYRLAMAHAWLGRGREDAEGALLDGFRHVGRLPERWQVVYRAFADFLARRYDDAHEALAELVESPSGIPDAHYLLGEVLTHAARYRDPRKSRRLFENALELDPTFKMSLVHLIDDCIVAEDAGGADRLLARYRQESPEDLAVAYGEIALLLTRGRADEAAARGEELMAGGHAFAWFLASASHLTTGNWARARRIADDVIGREVGPMRGDALLLRSLVEIREGHLRAGLGNLQAATEASRVTGGAPVHVARAQVLGVVGDVDRAVSAADDAIRLEPFLHPAYYWRGRILLGAGRRREAEETLDRLREASGASLAPRGEFWLHLLQAEIDLDGGNVQAAAAEVREASALAPEYRDRPAEWSARARVQEAAGDLPAAVATYREMLEPRNRFRWFREWWRAGGIDLHLALYELARLEEQAGDVANAREHYREFLDLWGDADLPVAQVKDAKSRLAALETE